MDHALFNDLSPTLNAVLRALNVPEQHMQASPPTPSNIPLKLQGERFFRESNWKKYWEIPPTLHAFLDGLQGSSVPFSIWSDNKQIYLSFIDRETPTLPRGLGEEEESRLCPYHEATIILHPEVIMVKGGTLFDLPLPRHRGKEINWPEVAFYLTEPEMSSTTRLIVRALLTMLQ